MEQNHVTYRGMKVRNIPNVSETMKMTRSLCLPQSPPNPVPGSAQSFQRPNIFLPSFSDSTILLGPQAPKAGRMTQLLPLPPAKAQACPIFPSRGAGFSIPTASFPRDPTWGLRALEPVIIVFPSLFAAQLL